MVIKRFILRLLFLILFSFYTISPIAYVYASENIEKNIHNSDETYSLSEKFSIYLWELIYTQLASTDNDEDTDTTTRLLLKKKRAIIPKNISPISQHIENFSLAENYFVLPSCSPIRFFIEHNASKPFRGAQSLHSGHSPPRI
ncbi:MAG: hypothetical protein A2X54_08115 [Nitrospirae bacterium GWF2_44_13]|nr:MAG: hypothetical protein A2X54_08115 [Nitrospirae bacterium GWF2_44_13]OGW63640.1 MAG: hypothetical protein A2222_07110 [Nitrospirae bacterium RIFOXYA2_FULL_44_9]OGW74335.1 MAG: hypothetical protein A2484_04885 [Nitrospirae bacterium RIFOXYC2_FULL_44_7]